MPLPMIDVTECSCEECSTMCKGPCCGTPSDMEALIEAGFGNRLMYDDFPDGEDMLKPALKGHEGKKAPWETSSARGCTFWKKGLCELHVLGLKPIQGKLAHHSNTTEQNEDIGNCIKESWGNNKGFEVIEKWKKINEHIV